MRIKLSVILTLLMVFCYSLTVCAAVSIDASVNKQSLDQFNEKDEVRQAINKSEARDLLVKHKDTLGLKDLANIKNANEIMYGEPYRVVVANKDVVKALLGEKALSEALATAPYYWEVPMMSNNSPTKPVTSFTVDFYDGKWSSANIGGHINLEEIAFSSNADNISAFLKGNALNEANSVIHFRIPSLHTDFLYIQTDNQEYLVPIIKGRDEVNGLKHKKLYTKSEVVSAIGSTLKAGIESTDSEAVSGSPSATTNKLPVIPILGGIVVVALVTLCGYKFVLAR